jgi:AcrR family transcriptional regulator
MYGPEDLTTRSRIRDAALRQFAEHGFKGATVRGIAEDAGVSAGLVQHHFPSKAALQEACDDHVLAYLASLQQDLTRWTGAGAPAVIADAVDASSPIVRYLGMALLSGSDATSRWFEELVEVSQHALLSGELGRGVGPDEDVDAVAAVMTAMQLGIALLYPQLLRSLGDGRAPEAMVRIGRAKLFLAPDRLVRPEVIAGMREAFDEYDRASSSSPAPRRRRRPRGQ